MSSQTPIPENPGRPQRNSSGFFVPRGGTKFLYTIVRTKYGGGKFIAPADQMDKKALGEYLDGQPPLYYARPNWSESLIDIDQARLQAPDFPDSTLDANAWKRQRSACAVAFQTLQDGQNMSDDQAAAMLHILGRGLEKFICVIPKPLTVSGLRGEIPVIMKISTMKTRLEPGSHTVFGEWGGGFDADNAFWDVLQGRPIMIGMINFLNFHWVSFAFNRTTGTVYIYDTIKKGQQTRFLAACYTIRNFLYSRGMMAHFRAFGMPCSDQPGTTQCGWLSIFLLMMNVRGLTGASLDGVKQNVTPTWVCSDGRSDTEEPVQAFPLDLLHRDWNLRREDSRRAWGRAKEMLSGMLINEIGANRFTYESFDKDRQPRGMRAADLSNTRIGSIDNWWKDNTWKRPWPIPWSCTNFGGYSFTDWVEMRQEKYNTKEHRVYYEANTEPDCVFILAPKPPDQNNKQFEHPWVDTGSLQRALRRTELKSLVGLTELKKGTSGVIQIGYNLPKEVTDAMTQYEANEIALVAHERRRQDRAREQERHQQQKKFTTLEQIVAPAKENTTGSSADSTSVASRAGRPSPYASMGFKSMGQSPLPTKPPGTKLPVGATGSDALLSRTPKLLMPPPNPTIGQSLTARMNAQRALVQTNKSDVSMRSQSSGSASSDTPMKSPPPRGNKLLGSGIPGSRSGPNLGKRAAIQATKMAQDVYDIVQEPAPMTITIGGPIGSGTPPQQGPKPRSSGPTIGQTMGKHIESQLALIQSGVSDISMQDPTPGSEASDVSMRSPGPLASESPDPSTPQPAVANEESVAQAIAAHGAWLAARSAAEPGDTSSSENAGPYEPDFETWLRGDRAPALAPSESNDLGEESLFVGQSEGSPSRRDPLSPSPGSSRLSSLAPETGSAGGQSGLEGFQNAVTMPSGLKHWDYIDITESIGSSGARPVGHWTTIQNAVNVSSATDNERYPYVGDHPYYPHRMTKYLPMSKTFATVIPAGMMSLRNWDRIDAEVDAALNPRVVRPSREERMARRNAARET